MDNKYYTPELGEITTSIRHEVAYIGTNDWYKHEGLATDPLAQYRVKYLDRQDIEELGWEYKGDHWYYKGDVCYRIEKENAEYGYMEYYWLHTRLDDPTTVSIVVGNENGYTLEGGPYLFDGQIKNFNELKTLMKWLNFK